MSKSISWIGAPSSAGSYSPGQEKTPAALRQAGFLELLRSQGISVRDRGDAPGFRWRPDPANPRAMNAQAVVTTARGTAEHVRAALCAGDLAVVAGGDCTVGIGTVAAAASAGASVGLVYFDLDADMQTPESTDEGALDWMGVAHMLGLPGTLPELSGMGERHPMLPAGSVCFLGCGNAREFEQEHIERLGLKLYPLEQVAASPFLAGMSAALWGAKFDRLLVHLDVDILNFGETPLAENSRKRGLSFAALREALRGLLTAQNLAALTITEINPDHGAEDGSTLSMFAREMASLLGGAAVLRRGS